MARLAPKQPGKAAPPEAPTSGAVLSALPATEPAPELLAHLLSKAVFERLKRYVRRKGMAEREIEDLAQQSVLEAWNARHTWGPTTDDVDHLLFRITKFNVVDEKKRFARSLGAKKKKKKGEHQDEDALRAEREARAREAARDPKTEAEAEYQGAAGDRDDGEVPPVDVSSTHPSLVTPPDDQEGRARIRRVDAYVEKRPGLLRAAGWLMRNYAGHSFREIAEADGTTENAVCVAVSKLRAELREAAKQGLLAIFVALFLGILVKRLHHRPQDDYGVPAPKPVPTVVAPSPPPVATPRAEAEELRRSARAACEVGMFRQCLDDLDAAARLDPAGEEEPSVRALHAAAREAVKHPK